VTENQQLQTHSHFSGVSRTNSELSSCSGGLE
jgi:hypothetical protein